MYPDLPIITKAPRRSEKKIRTPAELEAREARRRTAEETLGDIQKGYYHTSNGTRYGFEETQEYGQAKTVYVPEHEPELIRWRNPSDPIIFPQNPPVPATVSIVQSTSLKAVHYLSREHVGVLNFANPIQPGGGFLTGAEAQEESLARSSNLHTMLTSNEGTDFYVNHKDRDNDGFNSHAMIYAPVVVFIRDDVGDYVPPTKAAVITCAAVNRETVLRNYAYTEELEKEIENTMRERMARILRVFEQCGDKHVVLGSFGTGVFKNSVIMVAGLWADLLVGPGARYEKSFENIIFAIKDTDTFERFKAAFGDRVMTVTT